MNAISLYRVARWMYLHKIPFVPKVIKLIIFLIFNSSIPYQADIGRNTKCAYMGIGVVIHKRVVIGENGYIGPQVTIGGRSNKKGVPIIGNNVFLASGCKILGDINIGDNVIVGANAVVIKSVPDNCSVAGVPARIIKENIDIYEYCNLDRVR